MAEQLKLSAPPTGTEAPRTKRANNKRKTANYRKLFFDCLNLIELKFNRRLAAEH